MKSFSVIISIFAFVNSFRKVKKTVKQILSLSSRK